MTPSELIAWASDLIAKDIESVIPKIQEYGSIDLELMGKGLLEFAPKGVGKGDGWLNVDVGQQYAVIFYLMGKIARCISTIAQGEIPSDDTCKDITIYSLMLRHIREFGSWGVEEPSPEREEGTNGLT